MITRIYLLIAIMLIAPAFSGSSSAKAQSKIYDTYKVVAYKKYDNSIISESNTIEVTKKLKVFIPNAFSPDGDGINDLFNVVAEGITDFNLIIYNRWGELIFESNDIKHQWDGFYEGKLSQTDAYVYVVNVSGVNNEFSTTYKGTVSLLK